MATSPPVTAALRDIEDWKRWVIYIPNPRGDGHIPVVTRDFHDALVAELQTRAGWIPATD